MTSFNLETEMKKAIDSEFKREMAKQNKIYGPKKDYGFWIMAAIGFLCGLGMTIIAFIQMAQLLK